ncbi:MAG: hypothetical protein LUQ40_02185 [Methanomicrobiales archaeon]|nr:hypothetical protein [Methanomicrobiales archaeon]
MARCWKGPRLADSLALYLTITTAAPLVSIPVFILLNSAVAPSSYFVTGISVLFAGIIPLLTILVWSRGIRRIAVDIPERSDRPVVLAVMVVSYCAGTVILWQLGASWPVTALMFCYCTNCTIVFFINFFWKISIHAMGIAGPVAALLFTTPLAGLLLVLLLPPVMWSRVHLGRHSVAQVTAGAVLGFGSTALQFSVLEPLLSL